MEEDFREDVKIYKKEVKPLKIKDTSNVGELNRLADEGWIFMKAWRKNENLIYRMRKQQ